MSELPPRPVSGLLCTAAAALLLTTGSAWATADGPDFYRVTGITGDDVLNIRAEPDAHARKIGEIPPAGTCVRNLGCRGGLTFQEFTNLSEAQKAERLKENPRWCKVEYQGVQGWVSGRFLQEGACDAPAVGAAPELSRLVGVRGRNGESELQRLGYSYQGGRKTETSSLTFYKSSKSGRCLQVVTRGGRYESLGYVDDAECRSARAATMVATGKTSLSGRPGSDSYQTVCGVMVGGKTYRYVCEVTDLTEGKRVERTALRFPDNELLLVWGDGKRVDVQIEGLAAPIPATYSTSEGETDVLLEGKTYFYYSDRGLAAMEVKHFKP
jgi:hypothetical protein